MAGELTQLLQALERGDRGALDRAFALVYSELKRVARMQRRRGANDSFSTTALVHEVYLKCAQAGEIAAGSREHFYNVAASAMHQVLGDRARAASAVKRPHPGTRESLDDALGDGRIEAVAADLMDLDMALGALAVLDERLAEVVQLHLFAGLEFGEIASLRGVSERTVLRDWRKARAVLVHRLGGASARA